MEKQPLNPSASPAAESAVRLTQASSDADTHLAGPPAPPGAGDGWDSLGSTRVVEGPLSDGSDSDDADGEAETERRAGAKTLQRLGNYEIGKKIGEGAMGAVYKAYQVEFDRKVALKVLFRHVAANPKLLERFYREARVSGQLDHPNIIHGYEVGEAGGLHYFAMEYVSGQSLQRLLTKTGRLSVGDALYVTLRVAAGLHYVHLQGAVHRDVKPDNILVTRAGDVKVGDLGMVKTLDEEMSLTQTGHAVGTPWYMPLEQAKNSKDIDGRSDIYALGCVLYALLTGRPPFSGPTLVDVIQLKEAGWFAPARQFNRDVPEKLDLIIAKMAAKQVRHRYQNCAEVIRDLKGLGLAGKTLSFLSAPEPVAPVDRTPMPPAPERPASDASEPWYVRYRTPQGQPVTRKLTTAEVLKWIGSDDFDPATKASRQANEGFRALATYREFEAGVLGRVTKKSVDRQTTRYRELYQKFEAEAEDRNRESDAWEESRTSGILHRHRLWVWGAVGAAALVAVYAAYQLGAALLRGLFG